MENINNLKSDLAFIKQAVQDSHQVAVPAIYVLWAVIILIGFTLVDFAPKYTGIYWTILGPIGGAISGFLGWRSSQIIGQVNRSEINRQATHWISMMVGIFMVGSLVRFGFLNPKGLGPVILVLVSFAYVTAGNYLDTNLRKIGILMAVGFFPIVYFGQFVWSLLGIMICAGLLFTALSETKNAAKS